MTKVPNTITDEQMAKLSRRAEKANPMFSPKAVQQRLAYERQRHKADRS